MFRHSPQNKQEIDAELIAFKLEYRRELERKLAACGDAVVGGPGLGWDGRTLAQEAAEKQGACGCKAPKASVKGGAQAKQRQNRRRVHNRGARNRASSSSPWVWGDPFPSAATGCGDWYLDDWAVPLLDPLPCTDANGIPEDDRLSWYFTTGTTQTTRLPDGRFRMYFGGASISLVTSTLDSRSWPVQDSGGRTKFSLDMYGNRVTGSDTLSAWWHASGDDYEDLHFSGDFIGFLDSINGIDYPFYAPRVEPSSGTTCDDVSYAAGTITFEDSSTAFWAGWKSTSIRCSGASVVYRDVSVVYLEPLERYIMFAVECDGRGMSSDGLGGDVVDSGSCSICIPSGCVLGGTSKTRYVFFTCPDSNFRGGTLGPFPVAPSAPDYTVGQWIGVPQAFMSPDEDYVLFYVGAGTVNTYPYAGMHIASVIDLVDDIHFLENLALTGVDVSGMGDIFYRHFVNLGLITVNCLTPDNQVAAAPTVTDEQFVFSDDRRLHLYFANRDPQTVTAATMADVFNLPLTLISHAVASERWIAYAIEVHRSPVIVSTDFDGQAVSAQNSYYAGVLQVPQESIVVAADPLVLDVTANDILTDFTMVTCNPANLVDLLGTETITPEDQLGITVEMNDPNVYKTDGGDYIMIVHSSALGGMIRFMASESTASYSMKQC